MEYRLIGEYEKYHNLIIGFDFDNTVCGLNNEIVSKVIFLLQECKKLGFILCLYTISASDEWLAWKVKYCEYFGISPDYVNDSPVLRGSRKPFFNILLDDRAGLNEAYMCLKNVVNYIQNHGN